MKTGQSTPSPRWILRDIAKQLYYKEGGDWTTEVEKAKDFSSLEELVAAWNQCGVRDAEIVEHSPKGKLTPGVAPAEGSRLASDLAQPRR